MDVEMKIICMMFILVVLSGCAYDENENLKYTRSDCIQKVLLYWDGYSSLEVEGIINRLFDVLYGVRDESFYSDMGIAGYVIPFSKRNELYFQYRFDCENKKEKTDWLISNIVGPRVLNFPRYDVTNEYVVPSVKTIYLMGEFWKEDEY